MREVLYYDQETFCHSSVGSVSSFSAVHKIMVPQTTDDTDLMNMGNTVIITY